MTGDEFDAAWDPSGKWRRRIRRTGFVIAGTLTVVIGIPLLGVLLWKLGYSR